MAPLQLQPGMLEPVHPVGAKIGAVIQAQNHYPTRRQHREGGHSVIWPDFGNAVTQSCIQGTKEACPIQL